MVIGIAAAICVALTEILRRTGKITLELVNEDDDKVEN